MTSPRPSVSIITVVYNNRDGLQATLENINRQTYPHIELIVIDGGSTDGSLEVIEQFRDRIAYTISEPDKGIYDAMNKGLKAATGDYVWFINSSDFIESPGTLQLIADQFGLKDDVYYGETYFTDDKGVVLGTRTELTTRKLPEILNWRSMRWGQMVSHQSFIVKRELADLYDLQYQCSSDVDWEINALKKATTIVNTKMILTRYEMGGYSIQNQRSCWKERMAIMAKHYGWPATLVSHAWFVIRAIKFKLLR